LVKQRESNTLFYMSQIGNLKALSRSVVVVEDDAFMRSLIADSLDIAGFEVQTAANVADARRAVKLLDPDAIVIDIQLGEGPDGFDLAQTVRKSSPEIAVVFLTAQPDARFSGRAPGAVVKNAVYLNKNLLASTSQLVEALEAALIDSGTQRFRHDQLADRPLGQLSNTQVQVLRLIAEGLTNQQIAEARKRSIPATESAITRTLEALGIPKDAELNVRVAAAVKFVSNTNFRS
jgi:DNA-binding NarL/FixJ family response regulator